MTNTPKSVGYSMPAEWHPHESVWSAWPSHGNLWQEGLAPAQTEFVELCRAISDNGAERLNILVPTVEAGAVAEKRLLGLPVTIHLIPFGDIWLRDTAPVFVQNAEGLTATVCFGFNSWGGKYNLEHDTEVANGIAEETGLPRFQMPLILEGGSIEVDGKGLCLTTRQCLLNPNRNPNLTQTQLEHMLTEALGVQKILWLGDGLINDHTDGHIDTIARFVAAGKVLCMRASGTDDPNREILANIERDLKAMTDLEGRPLQVATIPSPGKVLNSDGELMPASYLNFYIANTTVVVPTYGAPNDKAAVAEIAKHFPKHKTVGLSAKAILNGGGAFHCNTQQQPSPLNS